MRWVWMLLWLSWGALAQTSPPSTCTPQTPTQPPSSPLSEEEKQQRQRWAAYRQKLQGYVALLPKEPDTALLMPVRGVSRRQVANTFGASRDGYRHHEGQDIFAPLGTPVFSATHGMVWRIDSGVRGGLYVFVVGAGGRRYYYAHLSRYAPGLKEGQRVTPNTVLGYVGNTGNARTTPPHLHFGVYSGSRRTCDHKVIDPLPLLKDRNWQALRSG